MAQGFNPLTPLLSTVRQVTEQLNTTNKQLSDTLTRTGGQLLGGLAFPGIPGLGAGNPGGSTHNTHNSNPNGILGGNGGLPNIAALFPAGVAQAFRQLEEVAIPAGVPRISALIPGAGAGRQTAEIMAAEEVAPSPRTQNGPRAIGVAVNGSRSPMRKGRALGVQAS